MTYSCKIVDDSQNQIAVYYKKGNFVTGKLISTATGKYYAGADGYAYPVLLSAKGIWMAVINSKHWNPTDNVLCHSTCTTTHNI